MARYQLTERTLIGNDLVEAGEIEFDGLPSRIFIPLDADGEARRAEFEAIEAARQAENVLASGRQALTQLDAGLVAAIREVVIDTLTEFELAKVAKRKTP
jgi:hypothetical protein